MTRNSIPAAARLSILAVAILITGCGADTKPIVKVEGTLKCSDGKPLPAGTKLMFNPAEGRTGTATAITSEDGSFKLEHVTGSTGAEIGKYTIQLTPPAGTEKEFYKIVPKQTAEGTLYAEITEGMGQLALTVKKGK